MDTDYIYIGAGIVLMVAIPLLLGRGNAPVTDHILEKRIISGMTMLAVLAQVLFYGNRELFFGFVFGSFLCRLLVFEGIYRITYLEEDGHGEKAYYYYLSFSVIVTLLLSADYLFFKNRKTNRLNRLDGFLLLFLLLIFLVSEIRRIDFRELSGWLRSIEGKRKKAAYYAVLLACIAVGSHFLVSGSLGLWMRWQLSFQVLGVLLLVWAANLGLMAWSRDRACAEAVVKTSAWEMIVFFLLSMGLGAVLSQVHTTYETISSLIVLSVISIALIWKDKLKSSVLGSIMLALYVVGVLMML